MTPVGGDQAPDPNQDQDPDLPDSPGATDPPGAVGKHGSPHDRATPGTGSDPFTNVRTGTLGMSVFLVSLSALFAATMAGYVLMFFILKNRTSYIDRAGDEIIVPPMPDLPPLPWLLWASTLVILVSSGTLQFALSAIRRGAQGGLRLGLVFTAALGLLFLGMQTICWLEWIDAAVMVEEDHKTYRFAVSAFLVLSGVHAAHVIGGVVPLFIVTARAFRGRYSAVDHAGVHKATMYWHFLDVVWVIMFVLLLAFG